MITLAISDLHCPFQHPHAFDFLSDLNKEYKPDVVVCIGDEVDMHAISNWNSDPDGMSVGDETATAKVALKPLWKLFPKMIITESNHTARPYRKAFSSGISRTMMRSYNEIYDAPSTVKWVPKVFIDGVEYFHGENMGQKTSTYSCIDKKKHSCVFGHTHAHGGVYYNETHDGRRLFGLNVGCLVDESAYAFAYGKAYPFGPTLGSGIVVDGESAFFIPLTEPYREKTNDQAHTKHTDDFVSDFIVTSK
jgi:predicted phosphodiesterase